MSYLPVDPCLGPAGAAAIRRAAETFGPYRTYVSAPQAVGVGRGLVRRHDAAMNHYKQRLAAGVNESLDAFAARTNLFRGTYGERGALRVEGLAPLWRHEAFLEGARALSGRALVEPAMLYANLMLPGQELPVHTDTPAFRGLDQSHCPEWLLVVMHHAGLFERWRVPLIGAVSFFGGCEGGALVVYDDGRPLAIPPRDDTAVVLETERRFHGVSPVGGPAAPTPAVDAGMWIEHAGGDTWRVFGERGEVTRLRWGGFRFSVQWKARCFRDAEERALVASHAEDLTLDAAVDRLVEDLRARGAIEGARPDDTALALLMIDTYIRFPEAPLPAG